LTVFSAADTVVKAMHFMTLLGTILLELFMCCDCYESYTGNTAYIHRCVDGDGIHDVAKMSQQKLVT